GSVASIRQIGYAPGPASISMTPDSLPLTVVPAPLVVSPSPTIVATAPTVSELRIPAGPRVTLYQHTSRGIRAVQIPQTMSVLDHVSFGTRADAAFVPAGVWRLCDRPQGRGQCFDYSPGQYPTLGSLEGRVKSAYVVSAAPDRVVTFTPVTAGRVVLY